MSYILDSARLLKSDRIQKTSLLINQNRIEFMRQTMENIRYMRMDLSPYLLTPGHVMVDFSLHSSLQFHGFKHLITNRYIKKGCTTVVTVANVNNENDLLSSVKEKRQLMINSPIDYYIGIKLPFKSLTPSLIRKCKRYNISVIFVDIEEHDNLLSKSWGWIRDAMFSNPITLVPYVNEETYSLIKKQKTLQIWDKIMNEHRLSSIPMILKEGEPISRDVLMRLGIYPIKGDLHVGGQVNYNLYQYDEVHNLTDGRPIIDFDRTYPVITTHQGKLIQVNGMVSFIPGIGEECFISISGRFIPQSVTI